MTKFVEENFVSRGQRTDFHRLKVLGRSAEQLQKFFRQGSSMESQGDQVREGKERRPRRKVHLKKRRKVEEKSDKKFFDLRF